MPGKKLHCLKVGEDTVCANTDTIRKSCWVAKRRVNRVSQPQQGHFEGAIKSLNCPKHSVVTPLANHGWPFSPGVLRIWHLACEILDVYKGSSTHKNKGLRIFADMENWHVKVMTTVNLTGIPLKL